MLLLGCPVDPRLGLRSRIGSYHSQPENPRPNHKTQGESSMSADENTRGSRRYVTWIFHKKYCVIGGVRAGGAVVFMLAVEHADLEDG